MKKVKISLKSQPRERMLRNQLSSLVLSGEIGTTVAKAKFLKREASSFFSKLGRISDLEKSKLCRKVLYGPAIKKAQEENFGGVKIYRLDRRFGDGAEMAKVVVEITTIKSEKVSAKAVEQTSKKEKRARK